MNRHFLVVIAILIAMSLTTCETNGQCGLFRRCHEYRLPYFFEQKVDEPLAERPFQRRMLALSVNDYFFANPLLYGKSNEEGGRRDFYSVFSNVAASWRIPKEQLFFSPMVRWRMAESTTSACRSRAC